MVACQPKRAKFKSMLEYCFDGLTMCELNLLQHFFGLTMCINKYSGISQVSSFEWLKYKSISPVSRWDWEKILFVLIRYTWEIWILEQPSNDGSSTSCLLNRNQGLFPYFHFLCVTPCQGMPYWEDYSSRRSTRMCPSAWQLARRALRTQMY
jgi:hypothetical protein